MTQPDQDSRMQREYEELLATGHIWGEIPKERIKQMTFPRYSEELKARFLAITDMTSVVSDVLDSIGVRAVVPAARIGPVIRGKRIAGTVVTQRCIPERNATAQGYADKAPHHMAAYDAYFLSEPGDVLVADFGGNLEASNGGGNACVIGKARGFSGTIVYGAVRDVQTIHEIDYPVWSAGVTPMSGKYRVETIEINGPVTVHDVAVYPGDMALADDSGVAFIPAQHVQFVIEAAEASEVRGNQFQKMVLANTPTAELKEFFQKNYRKKKG